MRLEALDARLSPADRRNYEEIRAAARDKLDDAAWGGARQQGLDMTMEQAVDYALEVRVGRS